MKKLSPSLDFLTDLFRECSILRRDFANLQDETKAVQNISLNASIVSSQLGSEMRVYTEIAKQISQSTLAMQELITQMREEVNAIVNITLRCQIYRRRLEKYSQAFALITKPSARRAIKKSTFSLTSRLGALLRNIYTHLHPTNSLLKTVLQCQYRMVAALNAVKIESIHLPDQSYASMSALIDSLTIATDRGIAQLDGIFRRLSAIYQQAKTIERGYEQANLENSQHLNEDSDEENRAA